MIILKFNEHKDYREFHTEDVITLRLTDDFGIANLKTKMTEVGCSVDRRFIYYKFLIIETDSKKYPINSEMYFPLDFNNKTFSFIINIPDERFHKLMDEFHFKAKVEIIE